MREPLRDTSPVAIPPTVFISYSHEDARFARRIAADIRAKGFAVWVDETEIKVGDSLIAKLEGAITKVTHLAVILSPHSVESEWVQREVRLAMYREISGERIAVLPILYRECAVPGFLRDKIYADFRKPRRYAQALDSVVSRLRADHPVSVALPEEVEDTEFTRLWRAALQANHFGTRFSKRLIEWLREISRDLSTWSPPIFVSYLLFMQELARRPLTDDAIKLLESIIEDRRLVTNIRFDALYRIALVPSSQSVTPNIRIPSLFSRDAMSRDTLGSKCVEICFPTEREDTHEWAARGARVLGFLWEYYRPEDRHDLLGVLQQHMRIAGRKNLDETFLDALGQRRGSPKDATFRLFLKLSDRWREKAGLKPDNTVSPAVEKVEDIVQVAIIASRQNEHSKDTWTYKMILDSLKPDNIADLRELLGKEGLFKVLAAVVKHPEVEHGLSLVALITLLQEYGVEALYLDDELVASTLVRKARGAIRASVVDALCAGISEANLGDDFWIELLRSIHRVLHDAERPKLLAIVTDFSTHSSRLMAVREYFEGRIDEEALKSKLLADG